VSVILAQVRETGVVEEIPPIVRLQRGGCGFSIDTTLREYREGRPDGEWYTRWWISEYPHSWEPETFVILNRFLKAEEDYLDLGAWIGPTVLYAANIARHVYALEPDPVAIRMLRAHLRVNPELPNITLIEQALGDQDAEVPFGGNGDLGNSESTLLVRDPDYGTTPTARPWGRSEQEAYRWRTHPHVPVPQVTMETLGRLVDLSGVRFVKMDIEGGEKYALPGVLEWAKTAKPTLYLSLHWKFLPLAVLRDLVAQVYRTFPFVYDETMVAPMTEEDCLWRESQSLVCCWQPLDPQTESDNG
jgi:FkbM family methyltransferase